MKNITPTKHYSSTLHQLCKLIPSHLTEKLARRYGVDKKARTFRPWSHVVSLLFAQLAHAIGLNDVCDTLRHHAPKLRAIRGAVAPSRNALSHANRERDSDMMEALFWKVLGHLQELSPGFGPSGRYRGLPRRFKRAIHADRFHHHCPGGQLHGLGQAPSAQGRGEDAPAAQPAKFSSRLCRH